jgi:hypothetical protein
VHLNGPFETASILACPEHLGQHPVVEPVDRLVDRGELAGQRQVPVCEGLHRRVQQVQRDRTHVFEVAEKLGVPGKDSGELGNPCDIGGQIGNPLEVQVDVQNGGDKAEVRGNRALQSKQLEDIALDLQVGSVDIVVPGDHVVAERRVRSLERLQAFLEKVTDGGAEPEDLVF